MTPLMFISAAFVLISMIVWGMMKSGTPATAAQAKRRRFYSVGWFGGVGMMLIVMFFLSKPIFFGMIVLLPIYWMVTALVSMFAVGAVSAAKMDVSKYEVSE